MVDRGKSSWLSFVLYSILEKKNYLCTRVLTHCKLVKIQNYTCKQSFSNETAFLKCIHNKIGNVRPSGMLNIFVFIILIDWLIEELNTKLLLINPLIDWLFYLLLKSFHLYRNVIITGEELHNLGLCSAVRAFEQGGIFIVPHLLWHGTSVFSGLIHSPFTTYKGVWKIYYNPDPQDSNIWKTLYVYWITL
jgi:hypothetical protein